MKTIIAGGTGLIGQALIQSLIANQHEVVVLSRSPERAHLPQGARATGWDGKTAQGWGQEVETADAIINLAGENIGDLPWTNARKESIRSSRMQAGQALAAAVLASTHRPKVFLQASAVGYYGPHGDELLNE